MLIYRGTGTKVWKYDGHGPFEMNLVGRVTLEANCEQLQMQSYLGDTDSANVLAVTRGAVACTQNYFVLTFYFIPSLTTK